MLFTQHGAFRCGSSEWLDACLPSFLCGWRANCGQSGKAPVWRCQAAAANMTAAREPRSTSRRSIMKIVVIGSKVVRNLRERGHTVVVASFAPGVNTITGEGLDVFYAWRDQAQVVK